MGYERFLVLGVMHVIKRPLHVSSYIKNKHSCKCELVKIIRYKNLN